LSFAGGQDYRKKLEKSHTLGSMEGMSRGGTTHCAKKRKETAKGVRQQKFSEAHKKRPKLKTDHAKPFGGGGVGVGGLTPLGQGQGTENAGPITAPKERNTAAAGVENVKV